MKCVQKLLIQTHLNFKTIYYISVHPCDKPDRAGCEQTCSKKGEEAVCECTAPTFKLAADGKACDDGTLIFLKNSYNSKILKSSMHYGASLSYRHFFK